DSASARCCFTSSISRASATPRRSPPPRPLASSPLLGPSRSPLRHRFGDHVGARYHGVFAPASPDRARVVPRTCAAVAGECGEASVTDRQRALTWAQRLKRVFAIEIETCRRCGGRLRVIASIEAPTTIE